MNLTQKLAVNTFGTVLSLSLLQVNLAQAATVTYDISGSGISGFFSFDDSKIEQFHQFALFSTSLTDFNFQISGQTYTVSDLRTYSGQLNGPFAEFNATFNPNTGQYEPISTYVGLAAIAVKNDNTLFVYPVNLDFNNTSFNNESTYQFSTTSQTSSGVISYQQRVPEPNFNTGIAAGLGIVALGWLKKKKLRAASFV